MMYTTRKLKIGKTQRLDELAHEAGQVYTAVVVLFWRVVRHNAHWLSKYAMMRLVRSLSLHSQTVQAIIDTFFESLDSWRARRKTNPDAHPPRRRRWFHAIPFKESAISLKNGILKLSTGKGNEPVTMPWKYAKPKFCEISFNGKAYVLNATYVINTQNQVTGTDTAGIDLGEIHIAVVATEKGVIIANGRVLRSKRRYQNKVKAHFSRKMDKRKKGSRRWKQLNKAKKKTLTGLNNQINDILHKQTTKVVEAMNNDGVSTVGIGDLRDIRQNVDYGKKANQKIHQMPTGKVREMITYKAKRVGMAVRITDESYTSQTCPKCGRRHKPGNRNYKCPCGFKYHRDGVGAVNIRQKTMYRELVPVVGEMNPPVGLRYIA